MTDAERWTLDVPGLGEVVCYRRPGREESGAVPLVIVHGYAEHAGRHGRLAVAAEVAGHTVYAVDLPGHGRSLGRRAFVESYTPFTATVGALVARATADHARRPALFGHSMGGAVALAYALHSPATLAGLVLSAPYLLDAQSRPRWQTALAGPLASIAPGLPVTRLDPSGLARDPAVGAAYVADPLVHSGPVAAATGHTLTAEGRRLLSRAAELAVPTLVIHGEADSVASVDGSRELAASAGDVVRLSVIEGAYHEMHNEPEATGVPARFVAEVLGFLATLVESGPQAA